MHITQISRYNDMYPYLKGNFFFLTKFLSQFLSDLRDILDFKRDLTILLSAAHKNKKIAWFTDKTFKQI